MLQLVHNNVIANSDITYSYDSLGRTTNRSINSTSNSITWSYDAMSRITNETNALGSFGYAYVDDVSGSSKGTMRLASIAYPNSQTTISVGSATRAISASNRSATSIQVVAPSLSSTTDMILQVRSRSGSSSKTAEACLTILATMLPDS